LKYDQTHFPICMWVQSCMPVRLDKFCRFISLQTSQTQILESRNLLFLSEWRLALSRASALSSFLFSRAGQPIYHHSQSPPVLQLLFEPYNQLWQSTQTRINHKPADDFAFAAIGFMDSFSQFMVPEIFCSRVKIYRYVERHG